MNFSSLNRIISILEWFLWFLPTKEATSIKTTAETVKKLEPFINDLSPKVNQVVNDLKPAIALLVKNLPEMIKIYNDLQPILPELQAAAKVVIASWPEILKAYDTAQPLIKATTDLVGANKKKGMSNEDAVAHVSKFLNSRLDNAWK